MQQPDTGANKANDRVQAAIYRITDKQSISPGELARETEDDAELRHVRTLLMANKLDELPEPYSRFKNSLSTKHGLIFQDAKLVVPAGLQTTMMNLLHRDHAGIERMKQAAPYITWKSMDADLRRKVSECVGCYQAGKNIKPSLPSTEKSVIPYPNQPNEEIQLDFHGRG